MPSQHIYFQLISKKLKLIHYIYLHILSYIELY